MPPCPALQRPPQVTSTMWYRSSAVLVLNEESACERWVAAASATVDLLNVLIHNLRLRVAIVFITQRSQIKSGQTAIAAYWPPATCGVTARCRSSADLFRK